MPKTTMIRFPLRRREPSFTLIELLVVMAIIAILAALVLGAGNGVMVKASRSRASAEIQAISAALEGYKTDNGIYPVYSSASFETNYASVDPAATGANAQYVLSSEALYLALSGQTNFLDAPVGNKSYLAFKANQLGNTTVTGAAPGVGTSTYYQDPFHVSYGYNTGSNGTVNPTTAPYNGYGFFDLWSTGGKTGTTLSNTNSWIPNWQ